MLAVTIVMDSIISAQYVLKQSERMLSAFPKKPAQRKNPKPIN